MAELLPSAKLTDKVRRKLRKLLTLSSCSASSQQRYFKKFLKGLDKQYNALKSSVTECVTATASGDCDWLSSCLTGAAGSGGSRSRGYGSTESGLDLQIFLLLGLYRARAYLATFYPGNILVT